MTSNRKMSPIIWLILTLMGFYAGNIVSRPVRVSYIASHDVPAAINASLDAYKNPVPSMNRMDLIAGAAIAAIVLLALLYHYSGQHVTRDGEEHGSAAWASSTDMRPYSDKNPGNTLLMTHSEALALDTYKTRRNLNVLVTGASGSGKTRGYVLPNMTNMATHHTPISLAITDTKGEIHHQTAEKMRKAGWRIKTFNLIDMATSDHFNPLNYMNPDDPEGSLIRLADNIITNTGANTKNHGDFWDKASKSLLTGLLAYTYFAEDPETRTMNTVMNMLSQMSASESDPDQGQALSMTLWRKHAPSSRTPRNPRMIMTGKALPCLKASTSPAANTEPTSKAPQKPAPPLSRHLRTKQQDYTQGVLKPSWIMTPCSSTR